MIVKHYIFLSLSWAQLLQVFWFTGIPYFPDWQAWKEQFSYKNCWYYRERKKKGTFKLVTSMYLMLESKGVEDECN